MNVRKIHFDIFAILCSVYLIQAIRKTSLNSEKHFGVVSGMALLASLNFWGGENI